MEPCNLILLAAGFSRRFGSNKLLTELEGKPLYRHTLDKLLILRERFPVLTLTVVTQYREIGDFCREKSVSCIPNPHPEEGIAASLRLGLEGAEGQRKNTPAAFFVADQPWLTLETLERFLTGWQESRLPLACVGSGSRWGNPCGFAPEFFPPLRALTGDKGGKQILLTHREQVWVCQAKEQELTDVDVKTDVT